MRADSRSDRRLLAGLRLLVVEDVGMVAMALKSLLVELGCIVVGTTARLAETEEVVRQERLDGVLLDLNLGGQFAYPVIEILRERNIPFIIMSGYDVAQLCPDLAGTPQMQKPFERDSLEKLLWTEFVGHRQSGGAPSHLQQPSAAAPGGSGVAQKSQGEIESSVAQGMARFEQEYLGRGPRDVHAHLLGDLLVVRLLGVLTAAEQHLVEVSTSGQGRELLKQVRTVLIETASPQITSMIQVITGVRVLSMHHDISTVTGEEIVAFSLSAPPSCRDLKR